MSGYSMGHRRRVATLAGAAIMAVLLVGSALAAITSAKESAAAKVPISVSAVVGTWNSILHERLMHYPQGITYDISLKLRMRTPTLSPLNQAEGEGDITVVTNGRPPLARCIGHWWLTSSRAGAHSEIHVAGYTPEYAHRCELVMTIESFSIDAMTLRSDGWPFPPKGIALFRRVRQGWPRRDRPSHHVGQ